MTNFEDNSLRLDNFDSHGPGAVIVNPADVLVPGDIAYTDIDSRLIISTRRSEGFFPHKDQSIYSTHGPNTMSHAEFIDLFGLIGGFGYDTRTSTYARMPDYNKSHVEATANKKHTC